jgi:hypothetical protein
LDDGIEVTMAKKQQSKEILRQRMRTKNVYYYVDQINNLDIKSKEVFKNGKKEIHYPFRWDGSPKYGNIKKIIYENMPQPLPRGFNKSFKKGYGLTRTCRQLVFTLQDKYPSIETLIFSGKRKSSIGTREAVFDWQEFDKQYDHLSALSQKHSEETKTLSAEVLAAIFPKKFSKIKTKYIKHSVSLYINEIMDNIEHFSNRDVQAAVSLFESIVEEKVGINTKKTLKTKEVIEEYYIEEVLGEFESRLCQKGETSTLEKKWQQFFKDYNWIFSQLFASPVLYFGSEAYIGGKTINNKGGKIVDFIYKNALTNNLALIEIKTHLTPLLEQKPYRGKDVFSITKHFSGAIAQVLDQKDNLMKDFNKTCKGEELEAFNPRCIIVIGKMATLNKYQKKSFELFRSSCKDVHIVTFDEILQKLTNLYSILTGKAKKSQA